VRVQRDPVARRLRLGPLRRGVVPRSSTDKRPRRISHRPRGAQRPEEDVMQLVNFVKSFVRNDEGQDLLEYALLVALIALVAIAAVTAAGTSVSTIFQSIADKLKTAAGA
jgi:pilus assembly protein Flp/PilA